MKRKENLFIVKKNGQIFFFKQKIEVFKDIVNVLI